uniref:Uncharacterized protein n=1 Tax=Arundo donax TaxID=35708 RepID=A0A0A9CWX5_ARUDO
MTEQAHHDDSHCIGDYGCSITELQKDLQLYTIVTSTFYANGSRQKRKEAKHTKIRVSTSLQVMSTATTKEKLTRQESLQQS